MKLTFHFSYTATQSILQCIVYVNISVVAMGQKWKKEGDFLLPTSESSVEVDNIWRSLVMLMINWYCTSAESVQLAYQTFSIVWLTFDFKPLIHTYIHVDSGVAIIFLALRWLFYAILRRFWNSYHATDYDTFWIGILECGSSRMIDLKYFCIELRTEGNDTRNVSISNHGSVVLS